MPKRILAVLAICLMAATAAHAQYGGGGMGGGMGGGGGGHRGRGQRPQTSTTPTARPDTPRATTQTPLGKIVIVGVVKAIDPVGQRITIAYEPVDALNWPAGEQPFEVARTSLLTGVTVGEKVRFNVESQQIAALVPY